MSKSVQPIRTFAVIPSLPDRIEGLRELAFNLQWSWEPDAIELFRRLDPDFWEESEHNPVLMLGSIKQEKLEIASRDAGFISHYDRVLSRLHAYMNEQGTWYQRTHGQTGQPVIAYFSAEYGLTECLPIYSGGLGVLSGDHLKSSSDLGVPLVAVGLLYQKGYFRQRLNSDGWQQELLLDNDFHNLPLTLERKPDGSPLTIEIDYPGRKAIAQIWRVNVGRVRLYLIDCNIKQNRQEDQDVTDQLYAGDRDMRIRQEIVLGIGGIRALRALGLNPIVCHMNEGHSAFQALERMSVLMTEHGLSFEEAKVAAIAGNVFTTHTPVPAGNDYFTPELMDKYFYTFYSSLGISRKDFLGLGRINRDDDQEYFCMTVLALRLAAHSNGVSKLHKTVSSNMWQGVWPNAPVEEMPIQSITNGIHTPTWISHDLAGLLDRYLGPRWLDNPNDRSVWDSLDQIPAEELWRTHERRRERLVAKSRVWLRSQMERRGATPAEMDGADEVLDPEALTIGFARRFATYKRATLLLRDPERLLRLLNNPQRPVQIIFAGKAHPQDNPGKDLIRQIVHLGRRDEFRRRIVFIEDYDMSVARYLVQGCDVWLNTPYRPLEASGTSGMKAAANGALNLSVLDGWWDEAYQPEVGWAVGRGEKYADQAYQDEVESKALYDLIESDIVPLYYDRARDGLPRKWISRVKASMRAMCPEFNTHRMLSEYVECSYQPAMRRYCSLSGESFKRTKDLVAWMLKVREAWPSVRVENAGLSATDELLVGADLKARARVQLGALSPSDVRVELYLGRVDSEGKIIDGETIPMRWIESDQNQSQVFQADEVVCSRSGMHGFTVRVLPSNPDLEDPIKTGLIHWAEPNGHADW